MILRNSEFSIFLLCAILLIFVPFLSQGTYFVYLSTLVVIYGIASTGLNLLSGYAGQLSLGHAAFMAIGAYSTALISQSLQVFPFWANSGLHIWLGIFAGTTVAALFGRVMAISILRARGPYLAMMTIAFAWVVWKILVEWVSVSGGDLGISAIPKAQIGPIVLKDKAFHALSLVFLFGVLAFQHRIITSRFGIAIRGIKQDEIAIASTGIDPNKIKLRVFTISAAIVGLAGTLYAHHQSYINPDSFQVFDSVFILFAVLLGGSGTRSGPLIGAAILIVLPEMLQGLEGYRMIVYGSLILITLYFLPKGIIGEILWRIPPNNDASREKQEPPAIPTNEILKGNTGARLSIKNLKMTFGGLIALKGVDLEVENGLIHALIGPNGAGKTTLVNLVSGVYPIDSGSLSVNGTLFHISKLDEAARLGIVRTFQTPRVLKEMTVVENVMIGLVKNSEISLVKSLFGSRKHWNEQLQEVQKLLRLFGLSQYGEIFVEKLPQGHIRQVEIARALATRPHVLLLDEPAAGLLEKEVHSLSLVLKTLKKDGLTILLVEHNMDFVLSISDCITVLDNGVVIATGAPEAIINNSRVKTAYLGK